MNRLMQWWGAQRRPDSVNRGDHHGEKPLDLAFGDKALRYICESEARARKVLGAAAAADLHARLSDLEAVTEMDWLPVTIDGTAVRVEFHPGFCLLAEANEAKPPLSGGSIDWSRVGRLLLRKIEQT